MVFFFSLRHCLWTSLRFFFPFGLLLLRKSTREASLGSFIFSSRLSMCICMSHNLHRRRVCMLFIRAVVVFFLPYDQLTMYIPYTYIYIRNECVIWACVCCVCMWCLGVRISEWVLSGCYTSSRALVLWCVRLEALGVCVCARLKAEGFLGALSSFDFERSSCE